MSRLTEEREGKADAPKAGNEAVERVAERLQDGGYVAAKLDERKRYDGERAYWRMRRRERRRKLLHILCIALCAGVVLAFGVLFTVGSPYQDWNYQDPETAVMGTALHAMEWLFVRAAPVLLIGAAAGAFLTRRRT